MSQTSLNLVAITIFAFVLSSTLGPLVHLPPAIPAIAAISLMGLAAVDTLSFQGKGGTLLVDWFSRQSAEYRDRILHHEAGHFLVAHLLGIPITGYTLNAWEAFRQGQPGLGGVAVDTQELDAELQQGNLSARLLDRYCTVWMAGIAAEQEVYGNSEGGTDDRQTLNLLLINQMRRSAQEAEQKQRLATLQAKNLIQQNESSYKALVEAMRKRATVEECCKAIDAS